MYSSWRREFLKESLLTLGLQDQELNMEDINKTEKIERLIKAMNIAARILFPNERILFNHVFSGSNPFWDFRFRVICIELTTSLLNSALALETWSHFLRNTLKELIQEFESWTFTNIVVQIRQRLSIYEALEDVSPIPGGGIHPITLVVMMYCINSKLGQGLKDKTISPVWMDRMPELLESSLEANSKNYKNPLGYVFVLNNRRFIEVQAKLNGLGLFFGDDWLHKNTTKLQQNLELYLRSSWNKVVDFLKVDINQLEPSVATELMKDNLYWFYEHFDETCNIQSSWSVCDEELRDQIIKSVENILLPAYGSFLGTFEEFLGKHAYDYIKYGLFEVQDQLSNLFLLKGSESLAGRKGKVKLVKYKEL